MLLSPNSAPFYFASAMPFNDFNLCILLYQMRKWNRKNARTWYSQQTLAVDYCSELGMVSNFLTLVILCIVANIHYMPDVHYILC